MPNDISTVLPHEVNLRPVSPRRGGLVAQLLGDTPRASMRDIITEEVERAIAEPDTSVAILASVTVHEPKPSVARSRPIKTPVSMTVKSDSKLEEFWSASPAAREVEVLLARAPVNSASPPPPIAPVIQKKSRRKLVVWLIVIAVFLVAFIAIAFSSKSFFAKNNVLQNNANAVANLNEAKRNLEQFDFSGAANRFALAADDFEKASSTMSDLGASFLSIFGNLPGIRKVNAANNLTEAGRNISKAGENLAIAFSSLYKTNFFSLINPDGSANGKSVAKPIEDFKEVLEYADNNIAHATKLLATIDAEVIPSDKRKLFDEFKSKIPDFKQYIGQAIEYSNYLLGIVGTNTTKTYVMLLQNTSERRATGGFPGTYAVISFDRGVLKKVFVDDVYNIDGQIKENRIPPAPLQHITPNWGFRDVNWFADFPASARKIEEYYRLDGGGKLDGVFTITPTVIGRILAIIGPVEVPEHNATLTADNFMAELQNEVEYEADRAQPKKIVMDFQPKFFEKLAQQDKEKWLEIMKVLMKSVEEKHIMAYFNDEDLQKSAVRHGFGGELAESDGDYIQVNFSNVKGSKSDAVTTNKMDLATDIGKDSVAHTLTVTRSHAGGATKYGFYNKENPTYVKVYLPTGAVFDKIEGNNNPSFKPLVDFEKLGFKPDGDLEQIEKTASRPAPGVDVFEESGKTVIGYWQITKPQRTSIVTLKYHVPKSALDLKSDEYKLYWQKQSGSEGDTARWSAKIPDGSELSARDPSVQMIGDNLIFDAVLDTDQQIKIGFE